MLTFCVCSFYQTASCQREFFVSLSIQRRHQADQGRYRACLRSLRSGECTKCDLISLIGEDRTRLSMARLIDVKRELQLLMLNASANQFTIKVKCSNAEHGSLCQWNKRYLRSTCETCLIVLTDLGGPAAHIHLIMWPVLAWVLNGSLPLARYFTPRKCCREN